MLKTTIVTKPFVVIWFPNSFDITLDNKRDFEYKLDCGFYQHDQYQHEEFDTFQEADELVNKLWEI